MTTNINQFIFDINAFTREELPDAARIFTIKIALELLRGVVNSSPVGNAALWKRPPPPGYVGGRFKGNWQAALGTPKDGELDVIDAAGSTTIAKGVAVVSQAKPFQVIWLSNNVPYALRIEQGWSTQAPSGVVETNVLRVASRFRVSD